jgi:hypothetical protein
MAWYEADQQYTNKAWIGDAPSDRVIGGPKGIALVDVYKDGATTPGWGPTPTEKHDGFMREYERGRFVARPRVNRFTDKGAPFAFVMRSVNMIAIDIDRHLDDGGKDGFIGIRALGIELPETMAETSKSGSGRHLFYRTHQLWNPDHGFGQLGDTIGIAPGVDVRAVGCVYHYESQRWNSAELVDAPQLLLEILELHQAKKLARTTNLAAAAAGDLDDTEVLIMHDQLTTQLAGPIPAGKRNVTLYAIGKDMHLAGVPDWAEKIRARGDEIGLPTDEIEKIIVNASKGQP